MLTFGWAMRLSIRLSDPTVSVSLMWVWRAAESCGAWVPAGAGAGAGAGVAAVCANAW